MSKVNDFQTWWNEKYFHTSTPLYRVYSKFHKAGADLDYIDFLCFILQFGDVLPALNRQHRLLKRKNRVASCDRRPRSERSISEVLALEEEIETLMARARDAKRKLDKLKQPWLKHPLFVVLEEYNHPQIFQFGKGRKADTWGAFFLLAVTEHMRVKNRKPHSPLAYRLLKTLRGESTSTRHGRITAALVIQNLKNDHPTWPSALNLLRCQFSKRNHILRQNQLANVK